MNAPRLIPRCPAHSLVPSSAIPRRLSFFTAVALFLPLAAAAAAEPTLSLAGEWRFEIAGADANAHTRTLPGKIRLPGTIDDAGLGPKNTKAPTLEGPYRLYDYAGPAWYQRDIDLPASWRGQHVVLFLERCRWTTSVWLDDRRIGTQDSLIAPHVYDLGTGVEPGRHRLTICVDNTVKLDLGRFVSALFGGTWGNMNGIVGRIELSATPPVWIDDVQVYPRPADRGARVKVRIGNATGQPGEGKLKVGTQTIAARWDAKGGTAEVQVPLPAAKPWDEFSPNLTQLTVTLGEHSRTVQFGLRDFAAKGTQFTLNGRPIFLRGTLECSVFPLTGYPPTDVASWQRIYRVIKSYGLNHMRFHSWCPPEAAFTAADIEGVLLQPEGPQANVQAGQNPARDAFIEAEFQRIVDTYGNHPSFCTMALGNEYGGSEPLVTGWVGRLRERDPRHLYTAASNNRLRPANRQFTVSPRGRGIHGAGTEYDLREVVAADPVPTIGHEIGQWMFFPDFREMSKYRGVMAPKNFELIRDDMAKHQVLDLAPQYVDASGKFAIRLYKEEIEELLRTRGYAGFALLDLHDYPTQGTALIGPLDPFWDSKGFISPADFRRFCGPTVPLLRFAKRTFVAGETFSAAAELAHFGPQTLARVQPKWSIRDERGRELVSGNMPATAAPTGEVTSLGEVRTALPKVSAAAKLTVTVSLAGTEFTNAWDLWVYPDGAASPAAADVAVCREWTSAKAALAEGRKVLFFPPAQPPSIAGRFLPVFWSPVWFPTQKPNTMGILCDPRHPLFARFATDAHTDWQWYELLQRSRLFVLDDTPPLYRPILQVIDNFARNQKIGVIFEARVGRGRLLVCGIDLPGLGQEPAARQLLASMHHYLGSAAFAPKQEFSATLLDKLFVPSFTNKVAELGGKIAARGAAPSHGIENAIDGDPRTIWHTPWDEPAPGFPHEFVIEFPRVVQAEAVTCLPRQDNNSNGWIREYAVYASADGKTWGEPVASGAFKRDSALKTVPFGRTVEVKFLKFVARSSFDPAKPYASLAEFSVITVK